MKKLWYKPLTMPEALSLKLLGGFDAHLDGRKLPPLAKKTQAMVAYLAIEGGTHQRAHLATLLWGDTGEEQALQSLRKAISTLRQALGDEADTVLVLHERSVGLSPSAIDVDAVEFDRLARDPSPEAAARAVTIYRGHLLNGLDVDEGPFNEWLLSRRERLREFALNTMSRLLDRHVAAGAIEAATETASRLFELEPLHEPTHRVLIELYGKQGRRAAAARQYQLCVEGLDRELGVRPDAATEAAYRLAIGGSDEAAAAIPIATPPAASPPALVSATPREAASRYGWRAVALIGILIASSIAAIATLARPAAGVKAIGSAAQSLAVLPLANLSNDAEQEYLADGVTEALIHDLAQIGALQVISRTSAMRYKKSAQPLGVIARELGADLVLEGSIQRANDRIRITLQLIEAASDHHVFSRTFETSAAELFDMQRQIAREIAREVAVQVTPAEQARLDQPRSADPEAYRNYLLGRHFWNRRTVAALREAVACFQRAVTIDPGFARGHAALAEAYVLLGDEEFAGLPTLEALKLTKDAAARALVLDANSAEAHAALGLALFQFEWNWQRADEELTRAIALNPGYATAHAWYGWLQISRGRFQAAIDSMERARALDPLASVIGTSTGTAYYFGRRHDEALRRYEEVLKLDPTYPGAHVGRARVLVELGRLPEAREIFESALKVTFDLRLLMGAAGVQARMGDRPGARARLAEARATSAVLPAVTRAQLLFWLDEEDAAYQALSQAVAERSSSLLYLFVSPSADAIRDDPRFVSIVRRVNPELENIFRDRVTR
jgi:DNA-binding SARP family transcriptional activator/TolB-like protein/Flp pilus assembly protein TadD